MIKKLFLFVLGLLLIFLFLFFYKSNVADEYILKLEQETKFNEVKQQFKAHNVVSNWYIFDLVKLYYNVDKVPAGYYRIKRTMTTLDILRKLRNGRQDPIRWTISTATFVEELAGSAGQRFSFDSASFLAQIMDSTNMQSMLYTKETALTLFLPNTYEFYWNATPKFVMDKMYKELNKFWSEDRRTKAARMGLDYSQVYTLASLVQREYTRKDERSKIASVLLNRLKINMPLQVDASAKYATQDFGAKRVTGYHIQYNSPYNTYKTRGLPPGPICMPELSTIDAVLNPENSEYLYYCADPSLNGYHIFSKTYDEHVSIAASYHKRMDELQIK